MTKILDARVVWAEERWGFGVGIEVSFPDEAVEDFKFWAAERPELLHSFQNHVLHQLQNYTFEQLSVACGLEDVEWSVRDADEYQIDSLTPSPTVDTIPIDTSTLP